MTNEEQAAILSGTALGLKDGATKEKFDIAIKMAQWKDEQMLSIIEDKINYARKMIKENSGKSVRLKYEGMRKILIELKNELNVK